MARTCLQELETSKAHLDSLLTDTSLTLDLLSSLSKSFQAVELQTSTFQKQCESLLTVQSKNTHLADDIRDNLIYYEFLDPASRKLNAPGAGKTVRNSEFSEMLRKLDECLDYMESHVSGVIFKSVRNGRLIICSLNKRRPKLIVLDIVYC